MIFEAFIFSPVVVVFVLQLFALCAVAVWFVRLRIKRNDTKQKQTHTIMRRHTQKHVFKDKALLLVRWLYAAFILLPPLFHLHTKLLAGTGGVVSRFLPLLAVCILILGYVMHLRQRPLVSRIFWQSFIFSYVFAATLLVVYMAFLLTTVRESALPEAVLVILWLIASFPATVSVHKHVTNHRNKAKHGIGKRE